MVDTLTTPVFKAAAGMAQQLVFLQARTIYFSLETSCIGSDKRVPLQPGTHRADGEGQVRKSEVRESASRPRENKGLFAAVAEGHPISNGRGEGGLGPPTLTPSLSS